MVRPLTLSFVLLSLTTPALAASLKPSRLDCTVTETAYPNYPVGSRLRYNAKSDQIESEGFLSNIVIRQPKIDRAMLGNMGITGESFAQGPFGLFPFDVALGLDSDSFDGPTALKGVKAKLLTQASVLRVGAPDAELSCDIEVVNDR